MLKPLLLLTLLPSFLPQSFTIIGRVRDQSGQVVSGVRVSLLDDNYGSLRTVFVDSGGGFRFQGLGSGIYLIRIETSGAPYEEQTQRIELRSLRIRGGGNEPYPIDFILKPKKGQPVPPRKLVFAQEAPRAARDEYERGAAHLRNNRIELCFDALKKAIEIFPDYFDALEMLGAEYVKQGLFDQALPLLTRAVVLNRSAPKSLYALGVAHLKLNHATEAAEWLQKSADIGPNNPNVFMMLGLAHGANREYEQSEMAFKKALQFGGRAAAEAHFYLAGIYNKQERYRDARKRLELYLKEAQDIKDREAVKNMISKMKEKEIGKAKN
jgi:Flp pilus assembly protein TadD